MMPFYSDLRAFREIYSLRAKVIFCLLAAVAATAFVVRTERQPPAPSVKAAAPCPAMPEPLASAPIEPPAASAVPIAPPAATEHAPLPAIVQRTRPLASSAPPAKKPAPSEDLEPDVGF